MEWDDLRVFLAVAQAGRLRKAAGALRLGQPTIGRPFHQLGLSVGARLFERSANGHRLTREAQKLLPMAQGMADAAAAIDRRRAALGGDVRSGVRIVASEWAARFLLPRLSALANPHGDLSEIEADYWLLVHPDLKAVPRVRHVMERIRGLSRPAAPTSEDSVRVP